MSSNGPQAYVPKKYFQYVQGVICTYNSPYVLCFKIDTSLPILGVQVVLEPAAWKRHFVQCYAILKTYVGIKRLKVVTFRYAFGIARFLETDSCKCMAKLI